MNAVTAISTVESLNLGISYDIIKTALKNSKFPARLERVSDNPLTVIDGAHNLDGAIVLAEFLKELKEKPTLVIAMMKDKNCDAFLRTLLPYAKDCIITEIENPRCMSSEELSAIASKYTKNIIKTDNLKDAIFKLKSSKNPVFITGSLYLASEARKYCI